MEQDCWVVYRYSHAQSAHFTGPEIAGNFALERPRGLRLTDASDMRFSVCRRYDDNQHAQPSVRLSHTHTPCGKTP